MGVRSIKQLGDFVLRQRARAVLHMDESIARLLDDMAETMYDADGIGLAANQIGILRRVIVADVGNGLLELINPTILSTFGERLSTEACLSLPGKKIWVKRAERVLVQGSNRAGETVQIEAKERLARCLQHEIDHLDGILILDRQVAVTTERGVLYADRQHA